MKNKYIVSGFFMISMFILATQTPKAAIDYAANESYYQKLCAKRSSYNANKTVCSGYEKYLKQQQTNSKNAIASIKDNIAKAKNDINKILGLIKENDKVIEKKKKEIQETEADIKVKEEEIKKLEKEVMDRLAMTQEMNSENFIIDFLTSSVNLNDFLTKMDVIKAINVANNDNINDLDFIRKDLASKKKTLKADQKSLEESQAQQKEMLIEYRKNEAELFKRQQAEEGRTSVYNDMLTNINVDSGIAASKGFVKPVSHATVTATAWYYPASFGGGWHPGVDLANNTGTPIHAPANGVVLATGNGMGYGNYMVTAHKVGGKTYTFVYGHLTGYANFGKTIKQGQTIAYMGSTGNSTGPHLHFEVFKHNNSSLQSIVNQYKGSGDIYYGLGYASTGSCSSVCRLKPHSFLGVRYNQVY